MRFGAHLSIGCGWAAVAETARREGLESIQVFSRSPRGGPAKPIDRGEVARMHGELDAGGIGPLVVHVPYFVNLAAEGGEPRRYSLETLALDLVRAAELGASAVITHLGTAPGEREAALDRVAAAVGDAIEASRKAAPGVSRVTLLLENSGGGGGDLGSTLEDLAYVLKALKCRRTGGLGVCLDTCHAFVAGYDLVGEAATRGFLDQADRVIGLDRVKAFHLNDSKGRLGSHLDRHAHIGQGFIGPEAFRLLAGEEAFADLPGLLETPEEGRLGDLEVLRSLRDQVFRG